MEHRILRPLFALLLAALPALPATAQGAAERLRTVLDFVPETALDGGQGPIVAGFGNGDAVRWIAVRGAQNGDNPNTPNRFAAERSAAPNQAAIISAAEDDAIRAAIGLTPRDWVETWEVAQGPVRIGAMDIYPDSEMRLRGALFVQGFDEGDRNGLPVMWQGDVDYEIRDEWQNPGNPFGGDLGLPLRVAFNEDRAIWASGWRVMDAVLFPPGGATLASRNDAQALIRGLQGLGNLGGLVSVRAWLRNGSELPISGAQAGPVEALALADFANRETEGAAMVLHLAPGIDAAALAISLTEAWPILSDAPDLGPPEISAGDGTVTLSYRVDWGADGASTNQGYQAFLSALEGGRLGFLLNRQMQGG